MRRQPSPRVGSWSAVPVMTAALGLSAVGALLVVVWLPPANGAAAWVHLAVGLVSAMSVVLGVRAHQPPHSAAWYGLAIGLTLSAAADGLISSGSGWSSGGAAVAIILSGLGALALSAGTVLVGLRPRHGVDRSGLLIGAAVVISLVLLGWVSLATPLPARQPAASTAGMFWVALAGDALVVGAVVSLVSRRTLRHASLGWMLAAAAARGVSHLLAAVGPASAELVEVLGAILLVFSYVAWGASALAASMLALLPNPRSADPALSPLRVGSVVLVLSVPTAALVVERLVGLELPLWPVIIASLALLAIVIARVGNAMVQVKAADRERPPAADELTYQAAHDSLTRLPNRAESLRLIQAGLSRAQRSGVAVGLLFVDLDGFKAINDSLGHRAGDEVLRCVASRMRAEVRDGDVVGRLGGDEFVVLLEPLETDALALFASERLLRAIEAPITLGAGRQVGIGASVGVAISQDGGADPDVLLHEADAALYQAKQSGRGRVEVFDQRLRREIQERAEIEAGIVRALENDELVVYYQPVVHVQTGGVLGYEALVRWRRSDGTLVPPDDFIPVAEQSDLICELDTWVLGRATHQLAAWNEQLGGSNLFIAVNVSGRHIVRPRLRDDVASALQASGVDPRQLVLEITETALVDDSLALTNLEELRRTGVSISIDDFGSGYNSIARLEQLPVDIVKIDSRFVSRGGPSTNKLLKLIVQAAHAFGLPVVAEGVEHDYELEMLREIECESAQGYYLGRPLDPADIAIDELVAGRATSGAG